MKGKKVERWRIVVGIISVIFIISMWVKNDIASIYSTMPKEDVIPVILTSVAVILLKAVVIAVAIILIKWIITKMKKAKKD